MIVPLIAATMAVMSLIGQAAVTSLEWPLSYDGKSTSEFVSDGRTRSLISTRLPAQLSHNVLVGLSGRPDPVLISNHRFVSVSACEYRMCLEKAFFWIDTKTGVGLGAYYVSDVGDKQATLRLGSNRLSGHGIPAAARRALIAWLTEEDLEPATVVFIGSQGDLTTLASAEFARPAFRPSDYGPSFDCGRAAGTIERTICDNLILANIDLTVFKVFDQMRRGFSTTVERRQLLEMQRQWLTRRDTTCRRAADVRQCLEDAYSEQYERLKAWTPR
jgi:uncharacterized protein YecT (DUF1311 family)